MADRLVEPDAGQVLLGCRPLTPAMDPNAVRQLPDGSWVFGPAKVAKECICGSGAAGWVREGTTRTCGFCLKYGRDGELPTPEPPKARRAVPKTPSGGSGKKLTRREKRRRRFQETTRQQ